MSKETDRVLELDEMEITERVRASASHLIEWLNRDHGSISDAVLRADAKDALALCVLYKAKCKECQRLEEALREIVKGQQPTDYGKAIITADRLQGIAISALSEN